MVEGWTSEINYRVGKTLERNYQREKGKRDIPRPEVSILKRTDMGILGHITHQVRDMDEKE